jgi:hypothetical protein
MEDNSRYVQGNLFGDGKKYSPINLQQQYTKKIKINNENYINHYKYCILNLDIN